MTTFTGAGGGASAPLSVPGSKGSLLSTTKRSRRTVGDSQTSLAYVKNISSSVVSTTHELDVETQSTESEGHPWPRYRGSGRDVGGPFYTVREGSRPRYHSVNWRNPTGTAWYDGPFYMRIAEDPFSSLVKRTPVSTLEAWGAKAVALTDPTRSEANIGQLIGELYRDGIPALIGAGLLKTRALSFREYGKEYLNYEFGWRPLVADIRSIAKAVKESESILYQLKRDSGRNVRRRFTFPQEISTETRPGPLAPSNHFGYSPNIFLDDSVSATQVTVTEKVDRWFSGCFTYHLDPGSDALSQMARYGQYADKLLGLSLTPDLLWELAPWSWLADWLFNFGDVIANVSSRIQYGTVLRYGYIMEKRSYVAEYTATDPMIPKYENRGYIHRTDKWLIAKHRQKATPFGFGLLLDSFDEHQWAILAALGIARSPGSLSW